MQATNNHAASNAVDDEKMRNTTGFAGTNGGVSVSQAEEDFHELLKELSRKSQDALKLAKTASRKDIVENEKVRG